MNDGISERHRLIDMDGEQWNAFMAKIQAFLDCDPEQDNEIHEMIDELMDFVMLCRYFPLATIYKKDFERISASWAPKKWNSTDDRIEEYILKELNRRKLRRGDTQ